MKVKLKEKFIESIQALLAAWLITFIVVGAGMLLVLFIGVTILVYIFKAQLAFPPSLDMMYKTIKFTVFASIFSGTVVWIKEVVFGNHD